MSTSFRKLTDRIITDKGQVVLQVSPRLEYQALLGKPLKGIVAVDDPDISRYNRLNPDDAVVPWADDGEITGPPPETFNWNLPEKYLQLDLAEYLSGCYSVRIKSDPTGAYAERLVRELDMMRDRDMYPFLKCLIHIIDVFKENNVVWGIGRGSSCASLILFLIGVNRVDPVLYDIPIEEFLK